MRKNVEIKPDALRTFALIAETGSITKAAGKLGRTPSALSMTVTQLESDLGGELFEPGRRRGLSELGRYALERANLQLRSWDQAIIDIQSFADRDGGHIALGCVSSRASTMLPAAIRMFRARRRNTTLSLLQEASHTLAQRVADQSLDCAIATTAPTALGLSFEPLLSDPYFVWTNADSVLARLRRPITWRDLRLQHLIRHEGTDTLTGDTWRNLMMRAALTVQDPFSLLEMVKRGDGVAIMPSFAGCPDDPRVLRLTLADTRAQRRLGLLHNGQVAKRPGVLELMAIITAGVQRTLSAKAVARNAGRGR